MIYPLINVDALVKELLALKASQEELTKRVNLLEGYVYDLNTEEESW